MSGESISVPERCGLVLELCNGEGEPAFARVCIVLEREDEDGLTDYQVDATLGGRAWRSGRVQLFPRAEGSAFDLAFRALEALGARLRR